MPADRFRYVAGDVKNRTPFQPADTNGALKDVAIFGMEQFLDVLGQLLIAKLDDLDRGRASDFMDVGDHVGHGGADWRCRSGFANESSHALPLLDQTRHAQ